MLLTLPEIEERVDKLAKIIGASEDVLPTYGFSAQDGRPHIEIGSQGYYYLVLDRDIVCDRLVTKDINELLYKIFDFSTSELAKRYKTTHRVEYQDPRRLWFEYQVEILSLISSQWAERKSKEHEEILQQHPFNDG
jgi:hypothetical protein